MWAQGLFAKNLADLFLIRFWPVSDLFLTRFWPVSDPFLAWPLDVSSMCENSMCEHYVWALLVWCRMPLNTDKYENYHKIATSKREVLGPDVVTPKSTRITRKNEHRRSWRGKKVRELPCETRFRPFQDHRRSPKSTRIITKNEGRRSWRLRKFTYKTRSRRPRPPGKYENSHTKRTCKHESR